MRQYLLLESVVIIKKIMLQIKRFGYFWLDTWVMANVI